MRQGLGVAPTAKGLHAGASRRTGQHGFGTTTKKNTRGGTTSNTKTQEEKQYVMWNGERICVAPKELMRGSSKPAATAQPAASATGTNLPQSQARDLPDSKQGPSNQPQTTTQEKDKTSLTMQSQLTSSLVETSEDEQAKKLEAMKLAKKQKKGVLSDKELDLLVDIELCETETFELLYIPGVVVAMDTEEHVQVTNENKKYEELKQNKIGSDSYTERGSQTLNLTQKAKEIHYKGFQQDTKEQQASYWDITDSLNQQRISEAKKQQMEYGSQISEIMVDKLKNPNCLIDAEALASHISIVTTQSNDKKPQNKSGTTSSKSGGKSSSKHNMMKTSQSALKESTNKSNSDKLSGTSMSQTQTNAISSETNQGDFAAITKSVEYIEMELPDSMMKAIRIIERLLTQTKYHEQHVLYKNYPQVNLSEKYKKALQEEEEENQKKPLFQLKAKKQEKEEEKKEEDSENAKEKDENEVSLKSLFKFECDITEGRQVSWIDVNVANPDLVAVAYGEFDIDCTKQLKEGLLCFWTLKNPNFPEKIIKTEHSITCCQFSKKNPHFIAVGDSHGNISIYNVKNSDNKPVAESKDLEGKHTDIIWELQWVDRESKGEALVSISGDGRVIEWSMKKGLEFTELMQLKRETNPNQKDVFGGVEGEKKGGMTFINTGGLSLDFPPADKGMNYFAATEDCTIHKCSVSYSEQYLENYYGHTGPIYRVRCNPFWDNIQCPIFLTCSYDWTVRVWNAKENNEKLVCHQIFSLKEQVNDIEWSPETSSVFASAANDGRIEIWDLFKDNLGPIVTHFDKNQEGDNITIPKTVIRFSKNAPVLLSGNMKGQVDVYRINGLEHVQVSEKDQIHRLLAAIQKDDFTQDNKDKKNEEEGEDQ